MINGSEDLHIIQLSFSAELAEYLERVSALGALEGSPGSLRINPTLIPVIEAMHHVLAGGEVQVRIVRDGQQAIFQELQQRVLLATQEINSLPRLLDAAASMAV